MSEPLRKAFACDTRTDYHAVTGVGTTIATFDCLDLARSWVRANLERFPSLTVEEVTVSTTRRRVFSPRPKLERVK